MNAVAEFEPSGLEIVPGYSPKPARISDPSADTSPSPSDSGDPDTNKPGGVFDSPDLTPRRPAFVENGDFSIRNGIVTFS